MTVHWIAASAEEMAAGAGQHSKMESRKAPSLQGTFECELCGLRVPYSYYGQKPPNTYSVTLLEDSYVMRDPFSPDKDKFLILGSECSLCGKRVCVGTDCSLFYAKRFCLPCTNSHLEEFPLEIRQDLERRTHSKSQSSRKGDSRDPKKKQNGLEPERKPGRREAKKQKD